MKLFQKIKKLLDENNTWYDLSEHEPVRTSEEAARVRGSKLSEGAKALIFIADGHPVQVVVPGNEKANTNLLKKDLHVKDLRLATTEEAEKISGCQVGGIPPFGNLFDPPIPVYVSENLLQNEEIEFNAGDRRISIRIKTSDWLDKVHPHRGNYSQ